MGELISRLGALEHGFNKYYVSFTHDLFQAVARVLDNSYMTAGDGGSGKEYANTYYDRLDICYNELFGVGSVAYVKDVKRCVEYLKNCGCKFALIYVFIAHEQAYAELHIFSDSEPLRVPTNRVGLLVEDMSLLIYTARFNEMHLYNTIHIRSQIDDPEDDPEE